MAVQDRNGKWNAAGGAGGGYNSRAEAVQAERSHKNSQDMMHDNAEIITAVMAPFMKVAIALFIAYMLLFPKLVAYLAGFLIRFLFWAGTAGRIILTVIVTAVLCAALIVIVMAFGFIDAASFLDIILKNTAMQSSVLFKMAGCLAISALMGIFWFWRKNYFDIKQMGLKDFRDLFKRCFAIIFYGVLLPLLLVYFGNENVVFFGIAILLVFAIVKWVLGVKQYAANAKEAIKDAEAGDPSALLKMGEFYREGSYGLPEDKAKALDCYEQAAMKGFTEAQYTLGKLYMKPKKALESKRTGKKPMTGWYGQMQTIAKKSFKAKLMRIYMHWSKKWMKRELLITRIYLKPTQSKIMTLPSIPKNLKKPETFFWESSLGLLPL